MAIYPVNCVRSRCDDEVMVMTRYCALCAVRVGTDQLVLNFTLKGLLEQHKLLSQPTTDKKLLLALILLHMHERNIAQDDF